MSARCKLKTFKSTHDIAFSDKIFIFLKKIKNDNVKRFYCVSHTTVLQSNITPKEKMVRVTW